MRSIKKIIKNPWNIVILAGALGYLNWIPDRLYLCLMYRARLGKRLHLENPMTYNEKLQWLKLYDRNPAYSILVDKYLVRNYVSDMIGEDYLVPLLGVWDNPEEINFNDLPNQFVLKCNHDSGTVIICKNKGQFDTQKAVEILKKKMNRNFYQGGREWPYKNVKPRVLCEKYMVNGSDTGLRDYKIYCFDGVAKIILVVTGRYVNKTVNYDFFDRSFNWLDLEREHPRSNIKPDKPKSFEKMLNIAEKLSSGMPEVRVDLYEIDGKVFFGEMTLFPGSGFIKSTPPKWDDVMGDWIRLPNRRCNENTHRS